MDLVSVPLFLCIRRTTTAFTLLAEWIMLGKVQSSVVQTSKNLSIAQSTLLQLAYVNSV